MKYLKYLLSLAVLVSSLKVLATEEAQYARGLMVAVDTRDHRACQAAQERVRFMVPSFKMDLCVQDGANPFSIVVATIPLNEWDFMGEIYQSKKAPKSVRDQNVGFVSGSKTGVLFILPSARESDSNLRISLKRSEIEIASVRTADLSFLEDQKIPSVSVSFILKKLPVNYSEDQRSMTERMVRRVRISKAMSEQTEKDKEKSALSSLNILDTINTSIQGATTQNFELDVFLPIASCPHKNPCPAVKSDMIIPLGLGFSFTMHF